MLKKLLPIFSLFLFCLLSAGQSFSFETKGQDCTKCHTLSKDEAQTLLRNLAPDMKALEVRVSPLKSLWEIFYDSGGRRGILYIDFTKKYVFSGNLLALAEKKNLTQESLTALNRVDVSQIPLKDALVMGDEKAKLRVIVFTDPD